MAASFSTPYEMVKILLSKKRYPAHVIADRLKISKNTAQSHAREMSSQGLVNITLGRNGGIQWIATTPQLKQYCFEHIFELTTEIQKILTSNPDKDKLFRSTTKTYATLIEILQFIGAP